MRDGEKPGVNLVADMSYWESQGMRTEVPFGEFDPQDDRLHAVAAASRDRQRRSLLLGVTMPTIGVPHSALHRAFDEIQSSGHFTEGKYTRLFEDAITHWCDMPAVSVSNCGTGLFAVLR